MSDYLGPPVIIQRDLNLPATLWFDGSARSLVSGSRMSSAGRSFQGYLLLFLTKENMLGTSAMHMSMVS